MAQSYVSNINFREQRFIGPSMTYDGVPVDVAEPGPFLLNISISSQVPNPETSVCEMTVVGIPGEDPDGTIYSGQFRVKRNASTGTPAISIDGIGLTSSQISIIRSSISIVESPATNGVDDIATFTVNLTPIASSGIREFSVNIPFEDSNIDVPNNNIVIPFLNFDGSNAPLSSFPNPIIVSVDNDELSINAGSIGQSIPVISIQRNWSTSRNVTFANVYFNNISPADYILHLDVSEDFTNQEGIRFLPVNIPLMPSTDGNITTDLNFNLRISSALWKLPGVFGGGDGGGTVPYGESSIYRRLKYSIGYGIGRIVNGVLQRGSIFRYYIHIANSASLTATVLSQNRQTLTYNCNDSGATSRRPLSLVNQTGSVFVSIVLNIDRSNSLNNYFELVGYHNGPAVFRYDDFSNNMTVKDFVAEVKSRLLAQYPLWHSGLLLSVTTIYQYGRMGDVRSESVTDLASSPNTPNTIVFVLEPQDSNSTQFQREFISHDLLTDPSNPVRKTFREFEQWLIQNFGSFGLTLEWFVPDTTEWRDLALVPFGLLLSNASVNLVTNRQLLPHTLESNPKCLIDISCESTHFDQIANSASQTASTLRIDISSPNSTLSQVARSIASQINSIITNPIVIGSYPTYPNLPPALQINCVVPLSFYSNFLATSLTAPTANTTRGVLPYGDNLWSVYYRVPATVQISTGDSIANTFSRLNLSGSSTSNLTIQADSFTTLGELVNSINSTSSDLRNYISASLVDSNYGNSISLIDASPINPWDIAARGNINMIARADLPYVRRYQLFQYSSLSSLVNAIQADWASNIDVSISQATEQHSDARPLRLVSPFTTGDIRNNPLPKTINGTVTNISTVLIPTENVTISYNIGFASTGGGEPPIGTVTKGIQVALGGYEKDGVFYPYTAPNAFFEPVYNTVFPINFTTVDADVVYLLVKTRTTENSVTTYKSTSSCYSGLVKYSNGYNPYSINPFVPTDSKFRDVWAEQGIGVPTTLSIPVYSALMDVTIEDSCVLDSISLKITNRPAELDQFGFLAINRTNNTKSQTASKVARVFGLVLDNRSSWDVLISPEATLNLDASGTVFHLGSYYNRNVFDDDEGYDFTITTNLPAEVSNAISLIPVPGNPQVWIFRIEYAVKRYLAALLAKNNDEESLVGCYLDVDILVKGRTTGVEGTARITIYHDYTCVYDIGLCDFFWNLIDPPKPTGPEIIQNRIEIAYETLVDCSNLTTPINYNIAVNAPILITATNIPTFKNGNALLLIKSSYTPEVQGFYFPVGNQLDVLQFASCSSLNSNLPLMQRLNKEFLLLPNRTSPVTDIFEIRNLLISENSYLHVRPQFSFPPDDNIRDCNNNEVVIVGIGYAFKNWVNGVREDDIVIGLNLLFPQGLFTSPEINICYRYYYNQKET
jgi:hypothetical protein